MLISIISVTLISCSKSNGGDTIPGDPNNKVKGSISIHGGVPIILDASGNSVVYAKRTDPNGDVVITIYAAGGDKQVKLTLVNISNTGTYIFTNGNSGSYISCTLGIGNPLFGPYEMFLTPPNPPTGTITINTLTANSISGVYNATVVNSNGLAEITNGSFTGSW